MRVGSTTAVSVRRTCDTMSCRIVARQSSSQNRHDDLTRHLQAARSRRTTCRERPSRYCFWWVIRRPRVDGDRTPRTGGGGAGLPGAGARGREWGGALVVGGVPARLWVDVDGVKITAGERLAEAILTAPVDRP